MERAARPPASGAAVFCLTWQDSGIPTQRSGGSCDEGAVVAGNLTRDEARERARLLSVQSYAVELDLTEGEERFESVTTVRFTSARAGAETFIDLAEAKVR